MNSVVYSSEPYAAPLPEEMTPKERHFAKLARERLAREMRHSARRHRFPIFCLK